MMTIDEGPLRAILSKFTYRPNWRFSIREGKLRIDATVTNADDLTSTIELLQETGIPYGMNPSFSWERWLFDRIMDLERHEVREFFRIEGKKPYDPHK